MDEMLERNIATVFSTAEVARVPSPGKWPWKKSDKHSESSGAIILR